MTPTGTRPSKRRPGRTAFFASVAVLLFGILCPLLMEGAIRVVRPQVKSWMNIHAMHPGGLPFYHHRPRAREWIDIGETSYEVVTDARGHRVSSRTASARRATKGGVWFVGDSYTFGQGSSFENSFVGRVAAAGYRVDNCGVGGWGPAQYLADFEYNLTTQAAPDAVVLSTFMGNDYFDMIWSKRPVINHGVLGDAGDLKSKLKRTSHLYRLISNVYHAYVPGPTRHSEVIVQMATEEGWRSSGLRRAEGLYRIAQRNFALRCRELGIPLLVLVVPTKQGTGVAGGTGDLDYGLVTRRTLEFLRASGIEHVDLTPALAKVGADERYLAFDGHFTAAANAVAGRIVREWLDLRL